MREHLRLGRISGIPIGLNASVVVITALITWLLAASVLPDVVPGRSAVAYWMTAAVAAVVFFASLVAHEMAHALVARREGIGVQGITLWMLGGVSLLERDAPTAGAELRLAVAGPATSIVLGLGFGLVGAVADALPVPALVAGALWWLAAINVVLGVFNLLPAFPLDGGRVLRAALWLRGGDQDRATEAAVKAGRVAAYGLVALGVLVAMTADLVQGVWLMLLGWYLEGAGRREAFAAVEHRILSRLTAAEIMSSPVVTVPAGASVDGLLTDYVLGHHHSAFPVVADDGQLLGLVTLDGVRSVPAEGRALATVRTITTPLTDVPVVAPTEPATEVLTRMVSTGAKRALVADGPRLVGIISDTDVTRTIDVGRLNAVRP